MIELAINRRQYLELEKIAFGAFAPLAGFMTEDEFVSVVETMRLPTRAPFPLPVILDVTGAQIRDLTGGSQVALVCEDAKVGELSLDSVYTCDKRAVAEHMFGTADAGHPGVAHFFAMGDYFIGGPARLTRRLAFEFSDYDLTPDQTRAHFADHGWQTIAGFQTRNVPHRAHEYLQRLALEQVDGLFIQPLVGRKKRGDYEPAAILTGYRTLIDGFLPRQRVLLGVLSTAMRYAGPREAIFHAIIRRNYGCTHFVIGRDHAGVGGFYGKYDAHNLAKQFGPELGIEVLLYFGPFHCKVCDGIVTERTCPHVDTEPEVTREISGTAIRALLLNGTVLGSDLIRAEVVESVRRGPLFIDEDDK